MKDDTTVFVGWDVHKDSVAIAVRQQLKAMLLRHGKRFPGKTSWASLMSAILPA